MNFKTNICFVCIGHLSMRIKYIHIKINVIENLQVLEMASRNLYVYMLKCRKQNKSISALRECVKFSSSQGVIRQSNQLFQ